MKRIGYIAAREFLGTVMTRGFVIGVLLLPALLAARLHARPAADEPARRASARTDRGRRSDRPRRRASCETTIAPQAIAARREEAARRALAAAPAAVRDVAGRAGASRRTPRSNASPAPCPISSSWSARRTRPSRRPAAAKGLADRRRARPIAIWRSSSCIPTRVDAWRRAATSTAPTTSTCRRTSTIASRTSSSTACARRIVSARARAQQLDRESVDAMVRVTRAELGHASRKGNERVTVGVFNRLLPFAFVGLLLISVLMGGQGLMTSTVEEKTSRVIEVLLSAVSPFELLAGKILGQMGVSLVVLGIYIGAGVHDAGVVRAVRPARPRRWSSICSCSSSSPT